VTATCNEDDGLWPVGAFPDYYFFVIANFFVLSECFGALGALPFLLSFLYSNVKMIVRFTIFISTFYHKVFMKKYKINLETSLMLN